MFFNLHPLTFNCNSIDQKMKIENLVFRGGGVLGMSYAGAIEVLEKEGILSGIKRYAGTSAGSITALALNLGCNANEIKAIIDETNFEKFQDHRNILQIPLKYGMYKGEYLLKWIQSVIKTKIKNVDLTFEELFELTQKELKVFATDLNKTLPQEFSAKTTPKVKVAEAIRASMSIPLFYNAWQFPDKNPNDHIYIDGGVLYNFPITAFKDLSKTLGLYIMTDKADESLEYNEIIEYVKRLFKAVLKGQDIDFFRNYKNSTHTITLDSLGISSTHFHINKKEKKALFDEAKRATQKFIEEHQKNLE